MTEQVNQDARAPAQRDVHELLIDPVQEHGQVLSRQRPGRRV
jgi:hypothetical protein